MTIRDIQEIQNQHIEKEPVKQYKCLGKIYKKMMEIMNQINYRISKGSGAISKLNSVLQDRNVNPKPKLEFNILQLREEFYMDYMAFKIQNYCRIEFYGERVFEMSSQSISKRYNHKYSDQTKMEVTRSRLDDI